mgnify:FL=1|tara:strand:+ start:298 stop:789 length:492 start_codon:yes stop_codon:yes gene_type:complete
MQIIIKNKNTLLYDDFKFKCCVGKNGISDKKKEGDKKTPKGTYSLGPLFYRNDRVSKIKTKLSKRIIKKNMGWCNDIKSQLYNKLIKINKKIRHEKLYRKSMNYDLLIPIQYNTSKPIKNKGSAIFLHITNNYKKTLGCIAVNKKDMLILVRLINMKTKIKIL